MEQILRKKDIVLVPFPFSDQSGMKKRPALIVSDDKFNQASSDIIICAITSNIDNDFHTVLIKPDDWKDGLYSESCVKVANILTVEKRIVLKRIGRLGAERFNAVIGKIHDIIK
jgi:mRNA interferase MazF